MKLKTRFMLIGIRLLGLLPITVMHRIAECVGWLLYRIPNSLQFKVERNISRCLPHLNAQQQQYMVQASLKHIIKMVLEMPAFWTKPESRLLGMIQKIVGEEPVRKAYQEGNGVILLGPHLGAWELSILYLSKHFPMIAMYKPQKDPDIDRFVHRSRERLGTVMVPTTPMGIRTLYKSLKQGKVLGILPDHDPGDKGGGEFVPFFGIQARTMGLINELAKRTRARVFLGYAKRLPTGQGYEIHYIPADPKIADENAFKALTSMNQDIERLVMTAPEQYEWGVKRFRKRPPGEADFYAKN